MKVSIIFDYPPSGFCPVQCEGWINGIPFYFRSRGSHWSLRLKSQEKTVTFREEYRGENYDPSRKSNEFAAGYATKNECLAFIERAAKELLKDLAKQGAPLQPASQTPKTVR